MACVFDIIYMSVGSCRTEKIFPTHPPGGGGTGHLMQDDVNRERGISCRMM